MMTENKKLSKADIFFSYINWITFALSCQNMERMMSPAFVRMFGRVAPKLYSTAEEQQSLLKRQSQFFNTEEVAGSIVPGIILGMEEKKACGEDIPDEVILSVKNAMMGPFAGIGDGLLGGTLRPILLSIALGISAESGSLLGPVFYCVTWFLIAFVGSWFLFDQGYKLGLDAAEMILSSAKDKVIAIANTVSLIVVGAISAQYVQVASHLSYQSGDMKIELIKTLDSFFPSLIPLLLTLLAWYLLDRKKLKIGWVFAVFIGIAIIAGITGIMTAP